MVNGGKIILKTDNLWHKTKSSGYKVAEIELNSQKFWWFYSAKLKTVWQVRTTCLSNLDVFVSS